MKKLLMLFCLISFFNFAKSDLSDFFNENIYDYLVEIIKGMSKDETTQKCVNIFINNKNILLPAFKETLSLILEKKSPALNPISLMIKFQPLASCSQFFTFIGFILNQNEENINTCGYNMMKKSKNIDKSLLNITESETLYQTLFQVGKIISDIINIYFV